MAERHRHTPRGLIRLLAIAAIAAMVGTAVSSLGGVAGASGSHQKSGGDIKFGLEAETTDYCLSRAQLAISGIQVVAAIYDTLTVPNSKGLPVPYLAKSVTPNANFTQWTIGLRPNVKFQDGEALDKRGEAEPRHVHVPAGRRARGGRAAVHDLPRVHPERERGRPVDGAGQPQDAGPPVRRVPVQQYVV